MANVSQHEAAELWEIVRDHHITGAKLLWMAQSVQDPSLRQMMQQHAHRYQQAAQQLDGFLHQGAGGQSAWNMAQAWQNAGQAGASYMGAMGHGGQGAQTGVHPFDVLAAGECLKDCKAMAVKCMWGATEASQPARGFLQQLAGEHLHMAEQHYRWLEQRGLYASPKADQQALQTYDQKLHQIAQSGQQAVQMAQTAMPAGQGFQYAAAPQGQWNQQSQYGQQGFYGQQGQYGQHHDPSLQYGQQYGYTQSTMRQ